jgi:hypothetical protein
MPQQWYYQQDGQTHGPVSRQELQQLVDSGQLGNDSRVIRDGMRDWMSASGMNAVDKVVPPPPVKEAADSSSPASPATRPAQSTYQRPPNRPQRPSNHLPLYFGSLAVVAVLAAIIGWMASSLDSSDNDKQSDQAEKQQNKRNERNEANRRVASKTIPATDPVKRANSTGGNEGETTTQPDRAQSLPKETTTSGRDNESVSSPVSPDSSSETASRQENIRDESTEPKQIPDVSKPTAEQVTSKPATQTQTAPKQEKPLVLFQELDIQRQPKLSMLGTVMAQDIHYRILSELHVEQPDEKGFRQVQQVVKDTNLVKADALSRTMFEDSLKRLIGWQFSYKLNLRNEVVEIRGPDGDKKIAPIEPAGAKGFLVTSVMDEDGWKELAELSFFTPDPKGMQNQSWSRQMTHNFEPLGSWFGETTFVPRGKEQGVLRFDYAHKMTYKPPEKPAAAAGGLPFTIKNADFKAGTAGGIIYYDTRLKRVHSAQEQFHVLGTLSADALGQVLDIPVEEKQAITVRIVDQNPWNNQGN